MNRHALTTAWHTQHIFLLMLLRPAALFARINALPWYRDMLRQWANSVTGNELATVLEAGCATGELTHYLAGRGHRITGVDASQAMLIRANAVSNTTAQFMQGSVMNLPFEYEHFQHVIAASLLNVVGDPVGALREMARICQPGGSVSVLVPQAGMPAKRIIQLADELQLDGFSRTAMIFWHRMARKLSAEMLEEYFRAAGFSSTANQQYLQGMVIAITGTRF